MLTRSLLALSLLAITVPASIADAQTGTAPPPAAPPPAAPPPAAPMMAPPPAAPAAYDATAPTAPPPAAGTMAPPAAQPPMGAPPPPPPPPAGMVAASGGAAPPLKGFSAWGILPWGGVGVGARFMIPLDIAPLLHSPTIRDGFALEFGADFLHWNYDYGVFAPNLNYSWNEILPAAGFMWNVWINDQLILYPKAELGYAFGWFSGWNDAYGNTPTYGGFFWDVALGAMYKLNNGITLRAEAGYAGLKLGAGLLF